MLNALRNSAGTWVVKVFLGLLVLSFAAWGIGDIFRLQPDAAVVKVGDTEITGYEFLNDFNRQVRRMQQSLGPSADEHGGGPPSTLRQGPYAGLRKEVSSSLSCTQG